MEELALLGGQPVLTGPLRTSVVVDESERKIINEVLDNEEFSRFMGSPTEDIEEMLVMPSSEAADYKSQYFTFLGGRMVRRFEKAFAEKFSIDYAVTVTSATSGISTALGAAGIGPGDEVITTCMSFNATAMAVLLFNSIPVFVDVSPNNFCLDPEKVEAAITEKTKAILVVHLLGFSADMDRIMEIAKKHNLVVIEDCAQAPGTKYKDRLVGTIGDMGVFSFQETKNMMTGEGGMIITNNSALARKCRLIRNHGESIPDDAWSDEDLVNMVGMNFRMTELTAALGAAQVEKLDENNRVRTENALYLNENLAGLPGLKTVDIPRGVVPHILPFLYDEEETGVSRDIILKALREEGVPVGSGYTRLMNENPIFTRKIAYGKDRCPWSCHLYGRETEEKLEDFTVGTELIRKRFIWFYHIFRPNGLEEMEKVAQAFKKVFGAMERLREFKDDAKPLGYKW